MSYIDELMKRPIDRRAELTVACAEVDRLRRENELLKRTLIEVNILLKNDRTIGDCPLTRSIDERLALAPKEGK
jgi:hypothetical protein